MALTRNQCDSQNLLRVRIPHAQLISTTSPRPTLAKDEQQTKFAVGSSRLANAVARDKEEKGSGMPTVILAVCLTSSKSFIGDEMNSNTVAGNTLTFWSEQLDRNAHDRFPPRGFQGARCRRRSRLSRPKLPTRQFLHRKQKKKPAQSPTLMSTSRRHKNNTVPGPNMN